MMYSKNLAAAIKVNGKILREFKDTVYLPFGAEYSLYLKNLNSKRAIVKISIDGQTVDNGEGFVLNANSTMDIERFVKNLSEGNRFKFIERTENIEKHRGIGIEDGLVKIEYQFEHKYAMPTHWNNQWDLPDHWNSGYHGVLRNMSVTYGSSAGLATPTNAVSSGTQSFANDAGITVPGSISEQKFVSVMGFPVESEQHVMVIKLLGQTEDNRPIAKPVTVKHKPRCITCGRQNRAHSRFCVECGTALEVVV